ncbi:MAG: DUF4837 family protein [Bacteroidales bacterium]|jgi:hypothetical protein|nr:DUF4837 family protein [Bacteroidales bacterium]
MKIKSYISLLCLAAVFFSSCGNKKGITVKVDNFSNGKAAEAIVIMDNKYWTDSQRAKIDSALTQPQLGLNQVEPMFDLLHFQNSDFTAHFQRHRNIVRFDINPDYSGNTLDFGSNVFASPQVYIHFRGNNTDSLVSLFVQNENKIIDLLYDNDLKRLQTAHTKNTAVEIEKMIREKFGITLTMPGHYTILRQEEDALWIGNRTSRNDRFIFIYKTTEHYLSPENVMNVRDEMAQKYILGAVAGAYPVIARRDGYPLVADYTLAGRNGIQMRGLWESVNDHMGGSFYNFTFTDANTGANISVDGFVYAPEEPKRDYLREVEAIVKSMR